MCDGSHVYIIIWKPILFSIDNHLMFANGMAILYFDIKFLYQDLNDVNTRQCDYSFIIIIVIVLYISFVVYNLS